jgi:hypothetical protein
VGAVFALRDTTNGLSCLYEFRGGGLGLPTPIPVTPAGHGTRRHFSTEKPVRVTRFGPVAAMIGGTAPPHTSPVPLSHTRLSLSFRPDGARGLPQTPFFPIDSGDLSVPGGSIHGAHFRARTLCNGQPGATRKILGLEDVGPVA